MSPISANRVLEMVDHLHRRGRVVDGRRERPDRDVDEDPEREGRVLLDRPLDPERDGAGQPALRHARERGRPVYLEQDGVRRDEVTDSVAQHDHSVVRGSPRRAGPRRRSPVALPTSCSGRRASACVPAAPRARYRRRSGGACSPARPSGGAPRGRHAATSDATLTGRRRWRQRSRKTRKSTTPAPRRNPAIVTPRSGTFSSTRRMSANENGERSHEHGECRLEDAVPVPEPHVARRERPRRHLDDEDGHGDDESGQADRCGDDGRQHRQRRIPRVVPAVRHDGPTLEPDARVAERRVRGARRSEAAPTGCP